MRASAPRTMVEFNTDIPDDTVFDPEGDIVQFGGRAVAAALGELLAEQGLYVEEPEYADDHGWEFNAKRPGCTIWVQVSLINEVLVMTEDLTFRWKFWENPTDYADILSKLSNQMRADGRFHDLLWYFPKEHDRSGPGASSPVASAIR